MNGRLVLKNRPVERSEIAELFLELPVIKPARKPEGPARRDRKSEDKLVPDSGPSGDLVPDSWGGIDLA